MCPAAALAMFWSEAGARIVGFGAHKAAEARLIDVALRPESSAVHAVILGDEVNYKIGTPGRHIVENSLAVKRIIATAGDRVSLRAGRVYVNGRPETVGYLSTLRLLAEHRGSGLLARGFGYFRELHQDGQAQLYLTRTNKIVSVVRMFRQGVGVEGQSQLDGVLGTFHQSILPRGNRLFGLGVITPFHDAWLVRFLTNNRSRWLRNAAIRHH